MSFALKQRKEREEEKEEGRRGREKQKDEWMERGVDRSKQGEIVIVELG